MEAADLGSSRHGGLAVKEESKRVESNSDLEEAGCRQADFALKIGKSRHELDENEDLKRSSPKQKDRLSCSTDQENDQLESTRAEMGEVREENQRLKMYLGRIMKDYQALQMQFNNIADQQEAANNKESTDNSANNNNPEVEETDLVSLSLGSFLANPKIKDEKNKNITSKIDDGKNQNEKQLDQEGLSLGLDYKYNEASRSGATEQGGPVVSNPSAVSSFEEPNKEEASETWPPSKVFMKPKRSAEDEVSQQNPVKKARVCVRVRCDTPTMNDGCQWRKYGQKIAKGNPCPRAYYRCTVAPSCPVRKQVQRCADDMSILITTYEGTHNHPLSVSATAMASTTSAAASMLLSGSSTSSSSGAQPPSTDQLHRFSTFDSSKWNINKQFYLPNSSHSSYSSFSSSNPTITLDLTSTPSSSSSSHLLNKFSSSSSSSLPPSYPHLSSLHYPGTSLSFGSSDSNNLSWSNNNNIINGFLSYGNNSAQSYNLKNQIGTLGLGRQTTSLQASNIINNNVNYQNYMQKPNPNPNPNPSITGTNQVQSLVPDTIAAATKAITADPTFQSALAAALSSIIGGGGGQGGNLIHQGGGDHNVNNNVAQKLKWGGDIHHLDHQQFPVSSSTGTTAASFLQTAKGSGGCATTFLNKTAASTNSQPAGNLMFLSPNSLSFSASKSASASPGDSTREQTS